jgi:HEAT repeat protein
MKSKYIYRISSIIFTALCLISVFEPSLFAWSGKILDKETGKPIEGAVIVRSWDRVYVSPPGLGSVSIFAAFDETLSNKRGKFSISLLKRIPHVSVPLFAQIVENRPIVFKSGYKFFVCQKKESVIELERIPTIIELRKQEVKLARGNYEIDFYETDLFRRAIHKEEEFVESYGDSRGRPPEPKKHSKSSVSTNKSLDTEKISSGIAGLKAWNSQDFEKSKQNRIDVNIQALSDYSLSAIVRSGAAAALGYLNDPRAVPALIEALDDENTIVRYQATVSLSKMKDPSALEPLIKAVNDKDPGVQYQAINALREMKDSRAVPALINALKDDSINVRYEAARALGEFDDPRELSLIGPMIENLGHKDERIRRTAQLTLVQIGEPAVEPLIEALASDNEETQRTVAATLGNFQDQRAIDSLVKLLLEQKEHVSWSAAAALGNYQDQKAIKSLVKSLSAKDSYLRMRVRMALYEIGPPVLDQLYIEIDSPDPLVRQQLVEILGHLIDARSSEPLLNILQNDPVAEIRKAAALSLSKFKMPRVVKMLLEAWHDEDHEVRAMAAKSLVRIGELSIKPLLKKVNDTNSYIRWRTAWCLGRIRDPIALKALIALLDDEVSEVKWTAIDALELINDQRAIESISQKLNDEDSGIREKSNAAVLAITANSKLPLNQPFDSKTNN